MGSLQTPREFRDPVQNYRNLINGAIQLKLAEGRFWPSPVPAA